MDINIFRVHAPFFQQQKKKRFLRIFCVFPTGEKNERGAPVGIRTRVEASKGPHDWPLHHRSRSLFK